MTCVSFLLILFPFKIKKGVASQHLTECFASAIKNEGFNCEQVTMLLNLTKDCDDDVGTFNVSVSIKKQDDCKTVEK